MFDKRERQLEETFSTQVLTPAVFTQKDLFLFKKEFQEFKAVIEEREKLKDRIWRERLAFTALLVASWSTTITTVLKLLKIF